MAVVRPYTFNKISPKRQHLVCTSPLKSLKVRSVVSFILCMNNQPVGLVFEGFDFRTGNSTSRQRAIRPENKTQFLYLISLVLFLEGKTRSTCFTFRFVAKGSSFETINRGASVSWVVDHVDRRASVREPLTGSLRESLSGSIGEFEKVNHLTQLIAQ